MRYRSDYYKGQKLSRSNSNMNRLCRQIEKWHNSFKWKRTYRDFDHKIMIDDEFLPDDELFGQIEAIFLEYCDEMAVLQRDDREIREKNPNFRLNWGYHFEKYRQKCLKICPNVKILANIAVILCYERYPSKNHKFIWRVAGGGVVANLKQTELMLPRRCDDGEYEYLGKRYEMVIARCADEL